MCDKNGHWAADCRSKQGNQNKKSVQTNTIEMETLSDGVDLKS